MSKCRRKFLWCWWLDCWVVVVLCEGWVPEVPPPDPPEVEGCISPVDAPLLLFLELLILYMNESAHSYYYYSLDNYISS
jgi:hypothetical protein